MSLSEVERTLTDSGGLRRLLQLVQDPHDDAGDAGDGGRTDADAVRRRVDGETGGGADAAAGTAGAGQAAEAPLTALWRGHEPGGR